MNEKMRTTLTERGQTSVPAPIRRSMALRPGTELLWEQVSEGEMRVTILQERQPTGARSVLGFARRFQTTSRTTAQWMAELREGES